MGLNCEFEKLDADKVVYNLSSRVLTNEEKEALSFGLKFALPPQQLKFSSYFLSFEKLLRGLKDFSIYGDDHSATSFISNFKHLALSYFYSFDYFKCTDTGLSKHIRVLKNLSKNKELLVLRPDKGNGIVLLDRNQYINKMNEIISDTNKFKPVRGDCLKAVFKLEDKLNRFLKTLSEKSLISNTQLKDLDASGSQPGILYGLPKVHKTGCPLRPILSAIGTHNYNLAKFLVPALEPLTKNDYTLIT